MAAVNCSMYSDRHTRLCSCTAYSPTSICATQNEIRTERKLRQTLLKEANKNHHHHYPPSPIHPSSSIYPHPLLHHHHQDNNKLAPKGMLAFTLSCSFICSFIISSNEPAATAASPCSDHPLGCRRPREPRWCGPRQFSERARPSSPPPALPRSGTDGCRAAPAMNNETRPVSY